MKTTNDYIEEVLSVRSDYLKIKEELKRNIGTTYGPIKDYFLYEVHKELMSNVDHITAITNVVNKIWGKEKIKEEIKEENKTPEYINRMLEEYNQLNDRTKDLKNFINSDKLTDVAERLGSEGVDLLRLQLETMEHYRTILEMRLALEGETNVELR